jgi:hypothetical protein
LFLFKFSLEFSTYEIFATFLTLITSVGALRWKVLVHKTRNKAPLWGLFIKLLFNAAYFE